MGKDAKIGGSARRSTSPHPRSAAHADPAHRDSRAAGTAVHPGQGAAAGRAAERGAHHSSGPSDGGPHLNSTPTVAPTPQPRSPPRSGCRTKPRAPMTGDVGWPWGVQPPLRFTRAAARGTPRWQGHGRRPPRPREDSGVGQRLGHAAEALGDPVRSGRVSGCLGLGFGERLPRTAAIIGRQPEPVDLLTQFNQPATEVDDVHVRRPVDPTFDDHVAADVLDRPGVLTADVERGHRPTMIRAKRLTTKPPTDSPTGAVHHGGKYCVYGV